MVCASCCNAARVAAFCVANCCSMVSIAGEAEGDLEARVEAEFFAAVGQREEVAVADMEQWLIEEKREPRGANVRLETDVRKLALED